MKLITGIYDAILMALVWLAGAIVVAAFALIIIDVSIRSFNYSPPSYTLAVIEYGLLYIAMLMAPYLVREKKHVFINVLVNLLPDSIRRIVEKLVYSACIITSLIFVYFSGLLFMEAIESGIFEERGVDMPLWLLYAPLPICLLMVAIEFTRFLFGYDSLYSDLTEVKESI